MIDNQKQDAGEDVPLVVDLDGTLIRTDLLVESFFALLTTSPLDALAALRHLGDKARFKAAVAKRALLDFHTLPLNEELVSWLHEEKAKGRRIYLASASTHAHVQAIADRVGLFDGIFASTPENNLAGAAKSAALCAAFGQGGFDYAGNAAVDLAVWKDARGVVVVDAAAGLLRTVKARHPDAQVITRKNTGLAEYRRVLRVHQWLKNLLIFVPAFTAHHFSFATLAACAAAFLSFSLCASSVYILNDLLDLKSDREHPTKRWRPFAAGQVDILHGLFLLPLTLVGAGVIALFLPWHFLLVLAGYYAVTMAYSLGVKRQPTLDVITLACLYGSRLVAGAAATDVPLSSWLLTFSVFLFLSLALVKRCSELRARVLRGAAAPPRYAYRLDDLPILEMMAASNGTVAVLTFFLYLTSDTVAQLYSRPEVLWGTPVVLLYWIGRILIKTHRGEMHDDPVLFAAKDRVSWICAGLIGLIMLTSI
ncbi:MAG: UbiA family prenyltransferase [Azospirillaceae bacterium]|nr:UbiA family prenyltransferase [Azospirillaceae bacterium]